jgi:hypothetical protein
MIEPWYCTREEVLDAMDFRASSLRIAQVDNAIAGGSRDVDDLCNRQFYPEDKTLAFDFPSFRRAYPWRIWFGQSELADTTANVPVVTSGGNVIAASNILWGPWETPAPPYTFLELDRSKSASFGQGLTPQQDVKIAATYGYWVKTESRGTLAATINNSVTTLQCSDGSIISGLGVGDILKVDSERMLINGKSTVSSTQTTQSGCTTNSVADNILGVTDGTKYFVGEQLLIDAERMLVQDIAGNTLIVKRAWGGSALATHILGATIYVYRNLTVQRASLGTSAASHTIGVTLYRYAIPGPVRVMARAEAINTIQQETSGYARTVGSADNARNASGAGIADIRNRVFTGYARKARTGVI